MAKRPSEEKLREDAMTEMKDGNLHPSIQCIVQDWLQSNPEPMPTEGLTPKQAQIYLFIHSQIVATHRPPTVREIGVHFGIKSPNGVMCHLKALERKRFITRESNSSRGIKLSVLSNA